MAALDFPTSPTNGQFYQGYVWNASNGTWDSSYQADTLKPSLAQIVVPTVSISGGTATANTLGTITFTNATSIRLDNVFTSTYKNYKFVIEGIKNATAGNDALQARLSSGGTPVSSSTYTQAAAAFAMSNAATQNLGGTPASALYVSRIYQASAKYSANIDVYSPALSVQTTWNGIAYGTTLGDEQSIVVGGTHTTAASYDGLYIFTTGNAVSGTISVYGYTI